MALVLDTGPIVALLDAADPSHAACAALVSETHAELVVPAPVLVEVDYWLLKLYGPEPWRVFVEDVARGAYRLYDLDEADFLRAVELERTYASLDLGLVDAAVVATCERLGETRVATLDRRDFGAIRPLHCEALDLVPG